MKILIDGMHLELPRGTGIKTYTQSVLAAIAKQNQHIDLLSQQIVPNIKKITPLSSYVAKYEGDLKNSRRRRLVSRLIGQARTWGQRFSGDIDLQSTQNKQLLEKLPVEWRLIERLRIVPGIFSSAYALAGLRLGMRELSCFGDDDLLFLTSPIPIYLPDRMNVLTVHDVIPLTHPWLLGGLNKAKKRVIANTLQYVLNKADKVICMSEVTRQEILKRFKNIGEKLYVAYQPCRYSLNSMAKNEEFEKSMLARLNLQDEPYILFVGAIEPKKNLINVLQAMLVNKKLPKLVLAGSFAWSCQREKAMILNLGDRVSYLGYVSERELDILQKCASAFVFPSIIEGFGLPPLEAMWNGVPCVLSDIPVFREIFADNAIYVNPYDPAEIADGLCQALMMEKRKRDAAANYVKSKYTLDLFANSIDSIISG